MTNECNSNGEEKLDENFKSIPNFEILVIIHDDFNNADSTIELLQLKVSVRRRCILDHNFFKVTPFPISCHIRASLENLNIGGECTRYGTNLVLALP